MTAENDLKKAPERDAQLAWHKQIILNALLSGYQRGMLLPGEERPTVFDAEGAWDAIRHAALDIDRLKGAREAPVPGKRGRPVGAAAENAVALLAPIYKRFTGARATASHRHLAKPKAKLMPFANGTPEPKLKPEKEKVWTSGPFVTFVIAVAEACQLFVGPDAVDKVIGVLAVGADDRVAMEEPTPEEIASLGEGGEEFADDPRPRAESQARFQSTHQTTEERFRAYIETLDDND